MTDQVDYQPTGHEILKTEVIQRIQNTGLISISSHLPDERLDAVPLEGIIKHYRRHKAILQSANMLNKLVNTPVVEYTNKTNPSSDYIEEVDNQIRSLFPDEEQREIANRVIENNRYKVNKLTIASNTLPLLPILLEDEPDKAELLKKIHSLMIPPHSTAPGQVVVLKKDQYKPKPKKEKIRIVKQYTKAAEMALKVLPILIRCCRTK